MLFRSILKPSPVMSCWLAFITTGVPSLRAATEEGGSGIQVGTERQLFVDGTLLESIGPGVFQILNRPLKYAGNPLIRMDRCWEAGLHFGNSANVLYDEEERLFKMWAQVVNYNWSDSFLAYYVSADGLHWKKPTVGQFDYHSQLCPGEPTRNHNFLLRGVQRPGVFKDHHETDPRKRYKMLYKPGASGPGKTTARKGTWAAFSADGIHWTDYPDEVNPVLLNNDTHQVVFWDPRREQYVAHIRLWPPVFKDTPEMWSDADRWWARGHVRVPAIATSKDFLLWDAPRSMKDPVKVNERYILVAPDERDVPATRGFYTLETLPYQGIYIGFLTHYRNYSGVDVQHYANPPTGERLAVPGSTPSMWSSPSAGMEDTGSGRPRDGHFSPPAPREVTMAE